MVDTVSIAAPSLTLKVSAPIKTHLAIHTHLATALNTSEKCTLFRGHNTLPGIYP